MNKRSSFGTLKFDLLDLLLDKKNDTEEKFYNKTYFKDTNYFFNLRS